MKKYHSTSVIVIADHSAFENVDQDTLFIQAPSFKGNYTSPNGEMNVTTTYLPIRINCDRDNQIYATLERIRDTYADYKEFAKEKKFISDIINQMENNCVVPICGKHGKLDLRPNRAFKVFMEPRATITI